MKDDTIYLRHILECIRRIEANVARGREQFMASHTLQDKAAHLDVEWRRIIAFRNVLVHDYLGIDLERVWEITQHDVPTFKRDLGDASAELISSCCESPPNTRCTGRLTASVSLFVCAGHVFTLGAVSPLSRLGRPKEKRTARASPRGGV
jgi:uncharacterized protein with HEPN domain